MARKILFVCGILSSLLYTAMNVFVPMLDPDYRSLSQTISELSAIDAPTRPLWVVLGVIYSLLVTAFGWGVWASARDNRRLRIVGGLLILYGVMGLGWPPMHQRTVLTMGGGTLTDTLHIAWTIVTILLMMLAIGVGATAFGTGFSMYSVTTAASLVAFGALTGVEAPGIAANLPTPWIGLWERINIGVFLLWVAVLAIVLMRARDTAVSDDFGGTGRKLEKTAA